MLQSSDEPSENEIVYKDQTYKIGDFVYIEPRYISLHTCFPEKGYFCSNWSYWVVDNSINYNLKKILLKALSDIL